MVFSTGCIPYIAPPLKFEIQGGVGNEPQTILPNHVTATMKLRAGAYPFGLSREMRTRKFDVGAGFWGDIYINTRSDDGTTAYLFGPHLEFNYYPWGRATESTVMRAGFFVAPELVMREPFFETGAGASGGLLIEWMQFSGLRRHSSASVNLATGDASAAFGWSIGEWGIGLKLITSHRYVDERYFWSVGAGLTFQLPAGVGGILVLPTKWR